MGRRGKRSKKRARSEKSARYVVGVDLGTTHCAVAASPVDHPAIELIDIPQLVARGETRARPLLPSFLYLQAPGELDESALALPWGPCERVVGSYARALGERVPSRLVASAKSWICHGGVNRRAPILPWNAPEEEPHISPFQASVHYLAHLRAAWDHARPDAPLAEQDVVVTVPASFDDDARSLTVEIAREAGLSNIRLIEEPQAAFYDFLGARAGAGASALDEALADGLDEARLILVVDIGGGTTDLTLVRAAADPDGGPPQLERLAVGGHLMLGGDNMDAALAHHVQQLAELESLDATEWSALVQAARQAKEVLLAADAPRETVVSIQRRGSRLIGNTRSVTLTRKDVQSVLLDGFLPRTRPTEVASRKGRAGLTTLGLPYTTDPAIPRHICTFLRKHVYAAREAGARIEDGLPRPDRLLLNGGVFNAPAIVSRLQDVLKGWYGETVPLLKHTSLDTAVARGAARYALGKRGFGQLITGGSARAYYIGVDQRTPGARKAFCVAPRGMDEGSTVRVEDQVFALVVGRMVQFPVYSYTGDRVDPVGALIEVPEGDDDDLTLLPPLETSLRARADLHVGDDGTVPVHLSATLTESGTLEIYLVTVELPPRQWRLEFALSEHAETSWSSADSEPEDVREPLPTHFPEAKARLEQVYGDDRLGGDDRAGKRLRKDLEKHLGPRGEWSSSTCRALASILIDRRAFRGRTPAHELAWLRLVGWCLRPGFGARGDAARVDTLWSLLEAGEGEGGGSLVHREDKTIGGEWWVLWRRVAGGLSRARQDALFDAVRPWLAGGRPPPGPRAHGKPEMIRMLAALEQLSAARKQEAGAWFLQRHKKVGSWWPLGRLGARQPFRGRAEDVVPPEIAEAWIERILELNWNKADGAAFAAVLIARMTGDPARDVRPPLRKAVLARLRSQKSPSRWIGIVSEKSSLSERDTKQLFGDSLPAGLRMK